MPIVRDTFSFIILWVFLLNQQLHNKMKTGVSFLGQDIKNSGTVLYELHVISKYFTGARTGWPSVRIMWLDEHFSEAAL